MTPWAEKKVGDLIDGLTAGVSVRSRDGDLSRPAVLKTSAVANGRVDFRETKAIVAADVSRAKCAPVRGSIVISRMNTPALVGAVGYVETDEPGVFLPDRLWLARGRRTASMDMRWLNYALGFGDVATSVRELATGTSNSMKNIPKARLLEFSLLVPSPEEQRAISSVLVDVDGLIASLERLIAKKKEINQGLMQTMLTGATRLAGFGTPWSVRRIHEVLAPRSELNVSGESLEVLSCTKHEGFVRSLDYFKNQVFSRDLSSYRVIRRGDIGYPANHIEEGSIGVQEIYDRAVVSPIYVVMYPIGGNDSFFLQRQMKLESFRQKFARVMNASVDRRGSLRWKEFSQIEVQVPDLDEQYAISRVLRDADNEIAALERRLASARAIKHGMMQELLTGRTRLTEEGAT
ncbi:restriction endonuclease subunit S [Leucobacter sp. UCD-THU]|uniref:restriction endonuclease subunit S n=1 Tax=Leucobacter sp. UCD-THU TaxID=1292023 RepID=UPI00039E6E94|nr:restriction endonuclease subunit S [Leucobacter sp. UCD-THU]